ncbi:MAG TPA: hypothetical protein VFD27_22830 [Chthoniobacteraceae bacterium]|nr:hypothetical protein [Chthoniobacteraceae bacterium]
MKQLDFQGAFTFPIAVDSSGDVYHCGTGVSGSLRGLCVAKYSGVNGALLWSGCAAPRGESYVTATAAVIDRIRGNVLVTGALASYKGFYTACFGGTDGMLRWDIETSDPASTGYEAYPIGIAVGASGYPIVTGWVEMSVFGSRNIQTVGYGPP